MHPPPHKNEPIKRGPITQTFNGKGVRPWLPEIVGEPGYVYVVTKLMTLYTPMGHPRRCCWRCIRGLLEHFEGHASVQWEDEPPASDARCPRCERPFGERPDIET